MWLKLEFLNTSLLTLVFIRIKFSEDQCILVEMSKQNVFTRVPGDYEFNVCGSKVIFKFPPIPIVVIVNGAVPIRVALYSLSCLVLI